VPRMTPLQIFTSQDRRFQIALPDMAVETMLVQARAAGAVETGGILIGHYSADHQTAIITRTEPPPSDSKAGPTWFERGIAGVKDVLQRMWTAPQKTFYLGEWHFHPFAPAAVSGTDDRTMKRVDLRNGFACQEPILLILGGDPAASYHVNAYIFPNPTTRIQLILEVQRDT
jgi:integrative and conjugative element protein (TIGR02256 family)